MRGDCPVSLPKAPPGNGGRRSYTHFHYCATEPGQQWTAWIAGPCEWYECHPSKRTKPCVHVMTDGKVPCKWCGLAAPIETCGYQALYREVDARPVFVVLHNYTRERVDALKLHERVVIGREGNQSDGVWVAKALKPQPFFTSTLKERMVASDLTETLLRVWGINELTEWYRKQFPSSREHDTPAPPAKLLEQLVAAPDHGDEPSDVPLLGTSWLGRLPPDAKAEIARRRNEEFVKKNGNGKHTNGNGKK